MQKTRSLEFFMTNEDEKMFCKNLKEFFPNISFLDTTPSSNKNIESRLFNCVSQSSTSTFSIVNFDFITIDQLSKSYEKYDKYYHFAQLGRGQIQFLRSYPDIYAKGSLQYGRIADSYYPVDIEEKKWKNKVYSLLKKMGCKVYQYYINSEGKPEVMVKPANNLIALPYAMQKYNGKNDNFMIHNIAKFVCDSFLIEK